jgi:hypothetical protein
VKDLPDRGRIGREEGTRELLFPPLPYVAVYRLKEQSKKRDQEKQEVDDSRDTRESECLTFAIVTPDTMSSL